MAVALLKDIKRPWELAQDSVDRNFEFLQIAVNQILAQVNTPAPVTLLIDAATIQLDAAVGKVFRIAALGNRLLGVPRHPVNGQELVIQHYAAGGANRTLTLAADPDGFRFGSTFTGLTATVAGKTDYIWTLYNLADRRWDVVFVTKGLG